MLSILIPIYNYNAYSLVQELHFQCLEAKISFEILCQDDFSNHYLKQNQEINTLENCFFSSNTANLGRGININKIARKAKQEWLLILDCDTFPKDSKFIERYLVEIQKNDQPIIFGGIIYDQKKPASNQLLRWVYGNEREALSIQLRNKNPDNSALTSNLLLKKELFSVNTFDESIVKYGYEDFFFFMDLKVKKIAVYHSDNPTFHLNLETSAVFLNKTRIALENLIFIVRSKNPHHIDSKIVSAYFFLKKIKFTRITIGLFNLLESAITRNLLSKKPSIVLFDFYKLGYFCKTIVK